MSKEPVSLSGCGSDFFSLLEMVSLFPFLFLYSLSTLRIVSLRIMFLLLFSQEAKAPFRKGNGNALFVITFQPVIQPTFLSVLVLDQRNGEPSQFRDLTRSFLGFFGYF